MQGLDGCCPSLASDFCLLHQSLWKPELEAQGIMLLHISFARQTDSPTVISVAPAKGSTPKRNLDSLV